MVETFVSFSDLPPELAKHFDVIEEFVGHVDGKIACLAGEDNTYIDDGVIDADEAVNAVNAVATELTRLTAEVERLKAERDMIGGALGRALQYLAAIATVEQLEAASKVIVPHAPAKSPQLVNRKLEDGDA